MSTSSSFLSSSNSVVPPKPAAQHMPVFGPSQLKNDSQERLHQSQANFDALASQQNGSAPDPVQVTHDIRAGLMGLNASKFSDAILNTPDNQNVYVCRALLAVRSSFFAKLFFSDFAEHQEKSVAISVHAKPLKHIVEFAYTGDSTLVRSIASTFPEQLPKRPNSKPSPRGSFTPGAERLRHLETPLSSESSLREKGSLPRNPIPATREIHRTEVTDLVELAAAADYCDITALKKWCLKTLDSLIRINMKTACTALEALGTRAWDGDGDMMSRKSLMQFIANHPESCLLVPDCKINPVHVNFNIGDCMGALELSEKSLKELLETKFLGQRQEKRGRGSLHSEYMFQVIYFWGSNGLLPLKDGQTSNPKLKKNGSNLWHVVPNEAIDEVAKDADGLAGKGNIIKEEQDGPRWSSAKAMVKLLDLTKMRSAFLRDYVEGSGLVPQGDLLAAYRYHATHSEDFLLNNGYILTSNGEIVKNDNPFGIVPA